MAIVYRHRRLDTNQVFYIGIGKNIKRAYTKYGRNNLWQKIVAKTDYEVDILAIELSEEDVKELEIFLISIYGRIDLGTGTLANLTDGGDGINNISEESRKKISDAITIRNKGVKQTSEQIEKRASKLRGKKRTKEQNQRQKQNQFEKGLTKPTIVYDYNTKEKIGEFQSLGDACRFLGINPESDSAGRVARKLRKQYKGYVFEYRDEIIVKALKEPVKRKPMKGNEVLNIENGIFYISSKEAYTTVDLKITLSSFNRKLRGERINDTPFIYV